MKKKQAWKVMGAVLAGTLVFSDAVPLRASAAAETEKSAVQNQTSSGTENDTETKTQKAAVYVDLKKGSDTADGTTAETAVKTVEKAQELLTEAAAELQAEQSSAEETGKADQTVETAAEKYLVFVGMDEKELEDYKKKQQKTDFWGRVTDTVFAEDETAVTEAGYEAVLAAEKAKEALAETPTLAPGESPAPDAADETVTPTPGPTETPDAEPTAEPTVTPDAEPTTEPSVTPDAEPTVTPDAEPTTEPTVTPDATATPAPDAADDTQDPQPTAAPDAEATVTPAPDQKTDDPAEDANPDTPAENPTATPAPDETTKEDPSADDSKKDDTIEVPVTPSDNNSSSDHWKDDENLDDLVKDEIQKDNETVKNYEEIAKPSETDSTDNGYLISDVSLLIQPMAISMARGVVSEEKTAEPTAEAQEEQKTSEGADELLAAAEQKSNLSAGEMVASAADDASVLRTTGTILVGPDNYGTNKTSTPTPTATPSKSNSSTSTGSSSNNSSSSNSGSNTGSTKIPQKKTQTTASIRSIPVNTGDETMVLPLAISSALSAAVMFCMAFLQMQAKRAKSMAAWLEFKKNHPFDEE